MDPATKAQLLERINKGFGGGIPHNAWLGMRVIDFGRDFSVAELPFRDELVGDPARGVVHGGVVTALIDATCGSAVMTRLRGRSRIATLDLRIDYMKPASPGEAIRCKATCYKVTTQVCFVRAVAYHEHESDPIASSAGTFMRFPDQRSVMAQAQGSES
jgi:uncharacterized protein (TIGR00369 family)